MRHAHAVDPRDSLERYRVELRTSAKYKFWPGALECTSVMVIDESAGG